MTKSRGLVSFRTFTLAFAVVLSPALMQTGGSGCEPSYQLEVLEFDVTGRSFDLRIFPDFTSGFSGPYDFVRDGCSIWECLATPDLVVRAYASHPDTPITYTLTHLPAESCFDELGNRAPCPAPISGSFDPGGGEVVLEGALVMDSCVNRGSGYFPGLTELRIDVRCPPTHSGTCTVNRYTVRVSQGDVTNCGPR